MLHLVVVTGMSGAGRSTALRLLEDLGYFCVDNLPPALAPQLVELLGVDQELDRIGLGVDVRTGAFLENAGEVLDSLTQGGHRVEVIFLEASDESLVRRFSETRRAHPLAPGGDLQQAIRRERERLGPLRARARHIIDTTQLSVHELRRSLVDYIARRDGHAHMVTRVVSFGFKYGLPVDADLVFDLRFLPNPHFLPELKPLSGMDAPVADFVFRHAEAREMLDDLSRMMQRLLPSYEREGKAYLTIGVGCTGGRHRSVAMAEALGSRLRGDRAIRVEHRDVEKSGG